MKKLFVLAFVAVFISCQQGAKEEEIVVDPHAITCERIGPVFLSFSHAQLVQEIGADNMADEYIELNGMDVPITRVFPEEAEEIIVYWQEESAPFETIYKIAVNNNFGPYQTAAGTRVGTTLDELRQQNNFMPISMTNFYASLDGFANIIGFNGGDIETTFPCLGGKMDIVQQKSVDVTIRDQARQEAELLSSHRIFSMLDVEVVELSVRR